MTPHRDRGIIDKPSNHSVDETVEKLKGIAEMISGSLGFGGKTLSLSVDDLTRADFGEAARSRVSAAMLGDRLVHRTAPSRSETLATKAAE